MDRKKKSEEPRKPTSSKSQISDNLEKQDDEKQKVCTTKSSLEKSVDNSENSDSDLETTYRTCTISAIVHREQSPSSPKSSPPLEKAKLTSDFTQIPFRHLDHAVECKQFSDSPPSKVAKMCNNSVISLEGQTTHQIECNQQFMEPPYQRITIFYCEVCKRFLHSIDELKHASECIATVQRY